MSAAECCPCCGELVGGNTYEISMIAPPVVLTLPVCRACEAVLTGDDPAAHDAAVRAFAARVAGGCDAPTVH